MLVLYLVRKMILIKAVHKLMQKTYSPKSMKLKVVWSLAKNKMLENFGFNGKF